jgi:hypothetical protein
MIIDLLAIKIEPPQLENPGSNRAGSLQTAPWAPSQQPVQELFT